MLPRCSNGSSPRSIASLTVSRRHRCILRIWFTLNHRGSMPVSRGFESDTGCGVRSAGRCLIGHRPGFGGLAPLPRISVSYVSSPFLLVCTALSHSAFPDGVGGGVFTNRWNPAAHAVGKHETILPSDARAACLELDRSQTLLATDAERPWSETMLKKEPVRSAGKQRT